VICAFNKYDRTALPVVDADMHMLGIITIDEVLDVAQRKATELIQRMGGAQVLDAPYFNASFKHLLS